MAGCCRRVAHSIAHHDVPPPIGFCPEGVTAFGIKDDSDAVVNPAPEAPNWADIGPSLNVIVPASGEVVFALQADVLLNGPGSERIDYQIGLRWCSLTEPSLNFDPSNDPEFSLTNEREWNASRSNLGKLIRFTGLTPGQATVTLAVQRQNTPISSEIGTIKNRAIAVLPEYAPIAGSAVYRLPSEATASVGYTSLATPGPSTVVPVGAEGDVLGLWTCAAADATSANINAYTSHDLSGANVLAASDARSCHQLRGDNGQATYGGVSPMSLVQPWSGLAAGNTTFDAMHRIDAGGASYQWVLLSNQMFWLPTGAVVDRQFDYVGAAESTASTLYTDLATFGPSVTVTVGASGRLWLAVSGDWWAPRVNSNVALVSYELSGANVALPAITSRLITKESRIAGDERAQSNFMVEPLEGLNPGVTTITMKYRTDSADDSAFFQARALAAWVD